MDANAIVDELVKKIEAVLLNYTEGLADHSEGVSLDFIVAAGFLSGMSLVADYMNRNDGGLVTTIHIQAAVEIVRKKLGLIPYKANGNSDTMAGG